jgi:hypothetical protein
MDLSPGCKQGTLCEDPLVVWLPQGLGLQFELPGHSRGRQLFQNFCCLMKLETVEIRDVVYVSGVQCFILLRLLWIPSLSISEPQQRSRLLSLSAFGGQPVRLRFMHKDNGRRSRTLR